MREIVPRDKDILGYCTICNRMRWLRILTTSEARRTPKGVCRQCARESGLSDDPARDH